MKRVLLTIAYDGSGYSGWQKQPTQRTIQGEIESAFFNATGQRIELFGSGRTDAGVHAYRQTAHFDLDLPIPIEKLPEIINNRLPQDIAITQAREVAEDFHARFSIKKKQYLYKIYNGEEKQPFLANYYGFVKKTLDINKMQECANVLIGTHDFHGYCSANTSAVDFVRTIFDIQVKRHSDNEIYVTVSGSGFLYNMVRIIVGTLVDYSLGKISLEMVKEALIQGNRECAGQTMPPNGLYLNETIYS
ncbi:MAG: tRNA pseudouridine(38-40) synthase TruA [Clostridia bacterium]|nr:tRNA pseudouridine(38-40) synthase TruA [Clostridia bacterium]